MFGRKVSKSLQPAQGHRSAEVQPVFRRFRWFRKYNVRRFGSEEVRFLEGAWIIEGSKMDV